MAAALTKAGFDVVSRTDAGLDDMNKALREFGNKLKAQKGVGLFYYSGHGTQVGGKSYLLAVDQDIQDSDEVAYKPMDAESVLAKMQSAGNILNLVFLDACRNNPFPGSGKSGERGLAVVNVYLPESVIVYAAEPGKTAADGEGSNSPFTQALLNSMASPGTDILAVMKKVKAEVASATDGQQSPRVDQNLSRDFAFYPAGSQAAAQGKPAAPASLPTAELAVAVDQEGADFYVDGKRLGQAPNLFSGLPACKERSERLELRPGRTTELQSALVKLILALPAPLPTTPKRAPNFGPIPTGFVLVPGGTFAIGSPSGDAGRSSNENQHQVTLSPFFIGATEVSQAQYKAVMGTNPSSFRGDDLPVETVSWNEAVAYCNNLSEKEGLTRVYAAKGPLSRVFGYQRCLRGERQCE